MKNLSVVGLAAAFLLTALAPALGQAAEPHRPLTVRVGGPSLARNLDSNRPGLVAVKNGFALSDGRGRTAARGVV
jgi:hypothetical protein